VGQWVSDEVTSGETREDWKKKNTAMFSSARTFFRLKDVTAVAPADSPGL
jgi:hypothetical protein